MSHRIPHIHAMNATDIVYQLRQMQSIRHYQAKHGVISVKVLRPFIIDVFFYIVTQCCLGRVFLFSRKLGGTLMLSMRPLTRYELERSSVGGCVGYDSNQYILSASGVNKYGKTIDTRFFISESLKEMLSQTAKIGKVSGTLTAEKVITEINSKLFTYGEWAIKLVPHLCLLIKNRILSGVDLWLSDSKHLICQTGYVSRHPQQMSAYCIKQLYTKIRIMAKVLNCKKSSTSYANVDCYNIIDEESTSEKSLKSVRVYRYFEEAIAKCKHNEITIMLDHKLSNRYSEIIDSYNKQWTVVMNNIGLTPCKILQKLSNSNYKTI